MVHPKYLVHELAYKPNISVHWAASDGNFEEIQSK